MTETIHEFPQLSPRDFCKGQKHKGRCSCLMGWLERVTGTVGGESPPFEFVQVLEQVVHEFAGRNVWIGQWNDNPNTTYEQIAECWNEFAKRVNTLAVC